MDYVHVSGNANLTSLGLCNQALVVNNDASNVVSTFSNDFVCFSANYPLQQLCDGLSNSPQCCGTCVAVGSRSTLEGVGTTVTSFDNAAQVIFLLE